MTCTLSPKSAWSIALHRPSGAACSFDTTPKVYPACAPDCYYDRPISGLLPLLFVVGVVVACVLSSGVGFALGLLRRSEVTL